ncbi:hypothetical protein UY3_07639 [Chelonia mydas]|uniref:Uncharacterized protein n=1 Tax=Chelonia mydas TaxID=8469 RepID=M7BB71_CHEMY|nr:hypothetical protein UY3_07639 [Chelonia mydas]
MEPDPMPMSAITVVDPVTETRQSQSQNRNQRNNQHHNHCQQYLQPQHQWAPPNLHWQQQITRHKRLSRSLNPNIVHQFKVVHSQWKQPHTLHCFQRDQAQIHNPMRN